MTAVDDDPDNLGAARMATVIALCLVGWLAGALLVCIFGWL